MNRFDTFLGNIDHLLDTSIGDEKNQYVHPALKNLGNVSIVLIREAIAPVVFRNAEEEITDIDINGEAYVRAVPNKFKYPEKGRGLQILRAFNAGGKLPQNKTVLRKNQKQSEAFDLNTLVFGDSAMQDTRVLPVKAAVNYSDALSVLPKHLCVDESFHNRAMEDGTLFDAQDKKNSDNLFTRHFVKPGTLMVQVLSTRGKVLPRMGLDHLLLSIGFAGSYGGQTSVMGTNIRSHIVGIYGSHFEQAATSPYEIVKTVAKENSGSTQDVAALSTYLHKHLSQVHKLSMDTKEALAYQQGLIERFEKDNDALAVDYKKAATKVAELFDNWFGK